MSLVKEVSQLIRRCRSQGFIYLGIDGAGHHRLLTPAGAEVSIPSTPKSYSGLMTAVVRLKRHGYEVTKPQKPKRKNRRKLAKAAAARQPAIKIKEEVMPKIEEVARITQPKDDSVPLSVPVVVTKRKTTDIMPEAEILQNLPLAGWVVWQHIVEEINAAPDASRVRTLQGRPGYEWQGSRNGVISKIWPRMPQVDYSTTPATMTDERRQLNKYLTVSRNMAVLNAGDRYNKTVWWVSINWSETDPSKVMQNSGNWWEDKVTPQEAGEDRPAAPVQITHKCDECSFVTANKASLGTHRAKFLGREHPLGKYPCPVAGCLEIRADAIAINGHVSRDHRELGLGMCLKCDPPKIFENQTERRQHTANFHGITPRAVINARLAAEAAAANVNPSLLDKQRAMTADTGIVREVPTPYSAAADTLNGRPVDLVDAELLNQPGAFDAVAALTNVLAEITTLREKVGRVEELEAEVLDLRDQVKSREELFEESMAANTELQAKYEKLQKKISSLLED